jgi:CheY-like chemotaxis protein
VDETEGQLRLRIRDAVPGPGVAERERLLHAFERLGRQPGAAEQAGVGLALCRRLAGLMQGEIGVEQAPGDGSVFWLRLASAAGGRPDAPLAEATGTVLYIEDNPVNVLLMEAMLAQTTRLHLLSAELPEDGLKMAVAHRPDLILLDIQLPGIDGYEVLRRLRAADETRDIPVIAVSANAMRSDLERGRAAGFDDYLTKPIDHPLLMAALGKVLSRG